MNARPLIDHAHRGGLASRVKAILPPPGLFDRVGGREGVCKIIDGHYDRIEEDPELFSIFRHNVGNNRRRQKMFFEEWMGGEPLYSRHVSTQGTRLFHYIFPITPRAAARWLHHFTASMQSLGLPPAVVRETLRVLGPMARALVRSTERGLPHRLRGAGEQWATALAESLAEDPQLLHRQPADFERMLFLQASAGHLDAVRTLVELGVDCNIPTWQHGVFITPWCIATRRGHTEVAEFLLRSDARVDVFSLAYLGDEERLEEQLATHPEWLDAADPASDHQAVPPIYHAICGGQYGLVRRLLEKGAAVGPQAVHWVRSLVDAEEIELAVEIAERSSDLSAIGPGHWVLHPQLADLLVSKGARVDQPAEAWLRYCTHRVGQPEEATLVTALIDAGADLRARLDGCSALHLAVRAGYAATVEVLLERDCEVNAEDDAGNTPLGYLVFAHRRADRPMLARKLLAAGADPLHADHQGITPLSRARSAKLRGSDELIAMFERVVS